MAEIYL